MIYKLDHDLSHISEEGVYDATLVRFKGWQNLYFSNTEADYRAQVPDPIAFTGNLEALAGTDFPYTSRGYPLMSWKLLLTLSAVAPFKYRTYPVRIYAESVAEQVQFSPDSAQTALQVTEQGLFTDRFVMVQLLCLTPVIDEEKSLYAELVGDQYEPKALSEYAPLFISEELIERVVVALPEAQLPALFQAPKLLSLLCSEAAVQGCRKAGIVGINFTSLPVALLETRLRLPERTETS